MSGITPQVIVLVFFNPLVRSDYHTPSEEVGRQLALYDRNGDNRRPYEIGLGHYYQGDIMLPPTGENEPRVSISDNYTQYTWPDGIVPYQIVGNFTARDRRIIRTAMEQFHRSTCIRFIQRRAADQTYLTIVNYNVGCFAYIGRQSDNDQNILNLQSPECVRDPVTPAHEMMHSLGFFHEHTRPDRDDWISINREALRPEFQDEDFFEDNFGKHDTEYAETYDIPYYYGSIMHYSRYAGAAGDKPVLTAKRPWIGFDFGSDTGLTPSDITAINRRYRCAEGSQRPSPLN